MREIARTRVTGNGDVQFFVSVFFSEFRRTLTLKFVALILPALFSRHGALAEQRSSFRMKYLYSSSAKNA